jgi:hypothetical protein
MGLDVYLYHCPNRAQAKAAEDKVEKFSEEDYEKYCSGEKYTALSETEQDKEYKKHKKRVKEFAVSLGCTGEDEVHKDVTQIEKPSKIHPKNYFKIGYFRSSYNDSGINQYFKRLGLSDLYDIFEPGDEYEFTPDWRLALERVEATITAYKKILEHNDGLDVLKMSYNIFINEPSAKSEKEALEKAVAELKRKSPFGAYSNSVGDFYPEGLDVRGIIMGSETPLLGRKNQVAPCTYIIYKKKEKKKHKKGTGDFYLEALEIVQETLEFVLSQDDPQNYYFHWSS